MQKDATALVKLDVISFLISLLKIKLKIYWHDSLVLSTFLGKFQFIEMESIHKIFIAPSSYMALSKDERSLPQEAYSLGKQQATKVEKECTGRLRDVFSCVP